MSANKDSGSLPARTMDECGAETGPLPPRPLDEEWPWRVMLSQHGVVMMLFYATKEAGAPAFESLSQAISEHRNWKRNERPETIEVTDAIGSHTLAVANLQSVSLIDQARLSQHALAVAPEEASPRQVSQPIRDERP